MSKRLVLTVFALGAALVLAAPTAFAARGGEGGRPHTDKVVYVTGQDLYYDTIVTAMPLPWEGQFQELEMTGPTGLQTDLGPGDPGYLGGRWWVDSNPNGYQDEYDTYFSCPLLGPGRDLP
jgi:hypothetical protein